MSAAGTGSPSTTALSLAEIEQLATDCLLRAGADDANAGAVARTVTTAERDGSVSHGLFRMPGYIASLRSGKVNGSASPQVSSPGSVTLRCDGQNGYAPLALERSLPELADAAKQYGLAALAITRSFHFAALWPEVEALADRGLVALTCVSSSPYVAPAGGTRAMFGTNPIAFAWPRNGQPPVVFDMATAAMAHGEISVAARDGHSVPPGCGLDANGHPTTDPAEILKGVLLPFGGYKGSALALMIDLLAGPMVGEAFSVETGERDNRDGGPAQGGQFVLALDPAVIAPQDPGAGSERFFSRYAALDGVRLPGARRHRNRLDAGPREINTDLVQRLRAIVDGKD